MTICLEQHRQRVGGIDVVVYHQNSPSLPRLLDGRLRARLVLHWGGTRRQADHELATAPRPFAVRFNRSPVHLDDTLSQSKPDAKPAFCAVERALRLDEWVEDTSQQAARDANPVIGHADNDVLL